MYFVCNVFQYLLFTHSVKPTSLMTLSCLWNMSLFCSRSRVLRNTGRFLLSFFNILKQRRNYLLCMIDTEKGNLPVFTAIEWGVNT